jgi:hypothetical protein
MAALANENLAVVGTPQQEIHIEASQLTSTVLLDVVEACLHRSTSEWIFLRELRVGTGFHGNAAQLLDAYAHTSELPIECGLVEIGGFAREERSVVHAQAGNLIHFEPRLGTYCRVTVPAPWRETPGPTWQFVAGMLRNQQKAVQSRPPKPPNQQRLPFTD